MKRCTAMMNCRRHRCTETCCEYESIALERERLRKKKLRNNTSSNDEDIELRHQCDYVCNKMLNCGKHKCARMCHAGPCLPCMESSPDDWHCPCGRTVLQAPIRCGSMLPTCTHPCLIEPGCGHPRVEHECHDANVVECPKCPYTVSKTCICGKNVVKGVQCYRETVSCGTICNEELECRHRCGIACHEPGKCKPVDKCKTLCGRVLPCGHKHSNTCHYPEKDCTKAKDLGVCQEVVLVNCSCGNLARRIQCHRITTSSNSEFEKQDDGSYKLKCDESCAILERNNRLAAALEIDPSQRRDLNHDYNDDLLDLYHTEPSWGDSIENQIIDYVKSSQMIGSKKTILKFAPMNKMKRMFIHLLAEEFGLTSQSQDSEPNRNVVILDGDKATTPNARLRKYYAPNVIKW